MITHGNILSLSSFIGPREYFRHIILTLYPV